MSCKGKPAYFLRIHPLIILCCVVLVTGCGGGGGSSIVTPPPPTLQSITVASPSSSLAAGLTEQFNATGNFSDGSARSLTGLTWSTSDPALATINGNGLMTTLKQGTVTVSAASGSIHGNAPTFTIGPPLPLGLSLAGKPSAILGANTPAKLSALLSFTDKSFQDISSQVTWSNLNPFTVTIDASGNLTVLHTGYTKISATTGAFSAATDFAVITVPRFLYTSSDGPRILSKAIIDPASGQLRMAGYQSTNANNSAVFPCQTIDPSGQFLYIGSGVNNAGVLTGEIQIYSLDQATGTPTPLVGSPFAFSSAMDCIQFERTGKFGFASNGINSSTQLLSFSRNVTTGALTPLTTLTLPGIPTRVALDPLGQYLYVSAFTNNFSSGAALGFAIDAATGSLTPIPGTPLTISNLLGNFSFHPSGNFVYMANQGGTTIDIYSIDRTSGKLAVIGSTPTCVNPTTVRFSPDGKFAFTACSMDIAHHPASGSVESFAVAANGALTHLGSSASADSPFDLNADPSGQFLYLSANTPYIYEFGIGADGVARLGRKFGVQPNQGFSMVAAGGGAAVTYTPKFAYITSTGDNKLSAYAIQSDGTLGTPISVATQLEPFSPSLSPFGGDLLVASTSSIPNLTGFPVSASTGAPGFGVNFGAAATSGGVATDFSGPWAFETDSTNGTVTTYGKFFSTWSLLTYLTSGGPVSSFAAGAGAGPVVTDPYGRFVFVANQGSNSISVYQYFGTSPELFEATGNFVLPFTNGSPFPLTAKPLALAVDPNEGFLYVLCNDQSLHVFAIDYFSGGHLAAVASTSVAQAANIAAEPTGRFVYAAGGSSIIALSVAQSGALTPITLGPGIAPANITGIYAEPSGKYLYVTTSTPAPGAVFAFAINQDGTLTAVSANPVATPNHASSMVFSVDAH
jgi:6-phosphogluconolactonase (cycloisomerase 2 family)